MSVEAAQEPGDRVWQMTQLGRQHNHRVAGRA